jgi:hypothetical protein
MRGGDYLPIGPECILRGAKGILCGF